MQRTLQPAKNGHNAIDLVKLIMAICVIAIHTNPLKHCTNQSILTVYELIVRMAVPFFFLASGYVLGLRLNSAQSQREKRGAVLRTLRRMIRMYVIWSILYLPLAMYGYHLEAFPFSNAVIDYIKGFFFIGEHYLSWQLWYLLSSIYALVFILLLLRLQRKPRVCLFLILGVCFLSIITDKLARFSGHLPFPISFYQTLLHHTGLEGRILQGAYYMPIGIFLARKTLPLRHNCTLFCLSFTANFFIASSVVSSMLLILSSISFFSIILHIRLKDRPVYPSLRVISTDMYLVHMYVRALFYAAVTNAALFRIECFVFTAAVSFIIGLLHLHIHNRKTGKADNPGLSLRRHI